MSFILVHLIQFHPTIDVNQFSISSLVSNFIQFLVSSNFYFSFFSLNPKSLKTFPHFPRIFSNILLNSSEFPKYLKSIWKSSLEVSQNFFKISGFH